MTTTVALKSATVSTSLPCTAGRYLTTWLDHTTKKVWLRDFLAEQLNTRADGVKTRVLSFGYDARTLFTTSNLEVDSIARLLLDEIETERENDAQRKRPIVFVAHSLGVIMVK